MPSESPKSLFERLEPAAREDHNTLSADGLSRMHAPGVTGGE
jgi:hypothetical protein